MVFKDIHFVCVGVGLLGLLISFTICGGGPCSSVMNLEVF
jgi:hypothetical protein